MHLTRALLMVSLTLPLLPATAGAPRLQAIKLDTEPKETEAVSPTLLKSLREQVSKEPKSRDHRFALVHALMRAKRLEDALSEARAWRKHDAYNLVVVRLIGDILSELGRTKEAVRAYSAVVELLPEDVRAHRALATVMKQARRYAAAKARLEVAAKLAPNDTRIRFELADTLLRLGDDTRALSLLKSIVDDEKTPEKIRYPAKQRVAQLLAKQRSAARRAKDASRVAELSKALAALDVKGGVDNDIKIYLTWDSDRTDVDLWVNTPSGEKIFYKHKQGSHGAALFDDVTDGYGPESFTAKHARAGDYVVTVHYYGTDRKKLKEARGEVVVIVGEGSAQEKRYAFPYKLYAPKQTVTVAKISVR